VKPLRFFLVCFLAGSSLLLAGNFFAESPRNQKVRMEPLVKDLNSGLEYRRIIAVQLLGRIQTPDARELLIRAMLRDKSSAVRRAAQRETAHVKDARVDLAVRTALADPKRRVRLAAVEALGLARDPVAADLLEQTIRSAPRDTELTLLSLEALRTFVYHVEPAKGFEASLASLLDHRNVKVRLTTLAILGILARHDSLQSLMARWPKASVKEQIMLADAFANIGWQPPVPLLQSALTSKNKELVIHALYALSQIQAFSALGPIRQLMETNPDFRVRMAGLNALLEIPDRENTVTVLKLLESPDPSVRHWAAYALGELNAQEAVPALSARLQDSASLVRATAVTALAELRAVKMEPQILALLNDPAQAAEVRVAAVKALMRLGSQAGAQTYWEALQRQDLDRDSHMTYALALGLIRDRRYRSQLLELLEADDFIKRFTAALTLGEMGEPEAGPVLIQTLDHGDPFMRRYAILGLEGLRSAEALKALADTANDDSDPLVRVLCASSLAAAGHTDYRTILWNALDNKAEDVRSEAVIALARSADGEVLRQLKWYLRREPSVPVRETILRVLRSPPRDGGEAGANSEKH